MTFFNRVWFATITSGTGAIEVGLARPGYRTPAEAGVPHGATFHYTLTDVPGVWEIGTGTYDASTETVERDVLESSNGDELIDLTGVSAMFITAAAQSFGTAAASDVEDLQETASSILAKLITVDGDGSGLDADALDGQSSAHYLSRDNHTGEQAIATVTGLQDDLDAKIPATEKGAAAGVATLDGSGKVPSGQLPAIAISSTFVVNTQAEQLALTAQEGDVAVRTDLNKSYIRLSASLGTMADWQELRTPTDLVLSVNGQTGAVTLAKGDVGLGNVDNTSDANKPVSTAQQAALDLKVNKAGDTITGALRVDGGIGVGAAVNVADNLTVQRPSSSPGNAVQLALRNSDGTALLAMGADSTAAAYIRSYGGLALDTLTAAVHSLKVLGATIAAVSASGLAVTGALAISGNLTVGGTINGASLRTTGTNNLFLGQLAGNTSLTGVNNTGVGNEALKSVTSGNSNTALGDRALTGNQSGGNNVAMGILALFNNISGGNNVGIGYNAGTNISTGSKNTLIGFSTGHGITTGAANTIVGANVTGLAAGLSNNVILADGDGNIRLQCGSTGLWRFGVLPPDYANDAAAAGGGVAVGGVYRNGSALMVRAA